VATVQKTATEVPADEPGAARDEDMHGSKALVQSRERKRHYRKLYAEGRASPYSCLRCHLTARRSASLMETGWSNPSSRILEASKFVDRLAFSTQAAVIRKRVERVHASEVDSGHGPDTPHLQNGRNYNGLSAPNRRRICRPVT
jgi:hypothetical protein